MYVGDGDQAWEVKKGNIMHAKIVGGRQCLIEPEGGGRGGGIFEVWTREVGVVQDYSVMIIGLREVQDRWKVRSSLFKPLFCLYLKELHIFSWEGLGLDKHWQFQVNNKSPRNRKS